MLILILLLATPVFAEDVYRPVGECYVIDKQTNPDKFYPKFKMVNFYIYDDAVNYAYLVNGLLLSAKDEKKWTVIHADGVDVPRLEMNCTQPME